MSTPIDVVITGFTPSAVLMEKSLAVLRQLRQEGVVRSIQYVTWDSAEVDPYLAPLAAMPEVTLTRVPQPQALGTRQQRGLTYQIENLAAALRLLPRDNSLVLKWRPDIVARYPFLRDKLRSFDAWSRVPERECFGVRMPPPVLQKKLWISWADSNNFFYLDDSAFLGTRSDVDQLLPHITLADLNILGSGHCDPYAHVVRYATPFLAQYPLFRTYLQHYRLFRHEIDYRIELVQFALGDGFFWHMVIAHAWILHSQFHVDIGAQGDLTFYANAVNQNADWTRFDTLRGTNPYDKVAEWRAGTGVGSMFTSICRPYGRLMDDEWQKTLFTQDVSDLQRNLLVGLMVNIARCSDGRLKEMETAFYNGVAKIYNSYGLSAAAGQLSPVAGDAIRT